MEAKARAAVRDGMKDPSSARFSDISVKSNAVCGSVNAKNSYGAYAGKSLFVWAEDGSYLLSPGAPDSAALANAEIGSIGSPTLSTMADDERGRFAEACHFARVYQALCLGPGEDTEAVHQCKLYEDGYSFLRRRYGKTGEAAPPDTWNLPRSADGKASTVRQTAIGAEAPAAP